MGKHPSGPWPGTVAARLAFERGARKAFPTLRGRPVRRSGHAGFVYAMTIDVPYYPARQITIRFKHRDSTPYVTVDGARESPHRYGDGTLCMWFPNDSDTSKWVFRDGLLDLLDTIVAHLFREAWWREHGEWLGDEVPHAPTRLEGAA